MSRAMFLGIGLCAAVAVWSRGTNASCGRPPDASLNLLPIGPRAPLNAQIEVSLPSSWRVRDFCEDVPMRCIEGAFELVLRRAPYAAPAPEDAAAPIASTQREETLGKIATVVITPSAPLAPRVRYEVVRLEKTNKAPPMVLGTFTTGDAVDQKPPAWVGIRTHSVWTTEPRNAAGVVTVPVECTENGVEIFADAPAADDGTAEQAMRYAVWIADEKQPLDFATPPAIHLQARLSPKRTGGFEMSLFVPLERDGKLALPNGKKKARIGVRAVDPAGNMSAPSEIMVKLP